jgi:DNA-binding GntR family transcriptional regulator
MTKVRWDNAVEEHEAILLALSQRDAARLGRILKQHLRNKCETVKESLAGDGDRLSRSA